MSLLLHGLADRLESDIRGRCLTPGHKYLTAEESALMLGTSVATANRALKILAERDIVVRRRNCGTFVGPAMQSDTVLEERKSVSILGPAFSRLDGSVRFDLLIQGIMASIPSVGDVRIGYVPSEAGLAYVKRFIEADLSSGTLAGVVAISCPRDVYRFLGECGSPLVVMGSLYPDQPYHSIDPDERAAGRMLVSYLIERGHRKLAVFSDSESCPGDNHFRDGTQEALTTANFPASALLWRAPGTEAAVLRAQVEEILAMPERPTGIVVKLSSWADNIAAIVQECGLRVPEDVEIVFKGYAVGEAGRSTFPHACPSISYRQTAELAGRMLANQYEHRPNESRTSIIPYEMRQSPHVGVVD
ncbi:MAG: substrate-binding domain-containing protein [Pirellulales bacterium]